MVSVFADMSPIALARSEALLRQFIDQAEPRLDEARGQLADVLAVRAARQAQDGRAERLAQAEGDAIGQWMREAGE